MNIQVYWDGNVGACEYEARKGFYTTKPVIPTVTFDTLVYSEDDNVATKLMGNTPSQLTSQEIVAVKQFANANSSEVPSADTVTVDKHNNDPEAHHDIRVSLSTLNKYAHQVASVWSTEVDLVDLNKASFDLPWEYIVQDINNCSDSANSFNWVSPANEAYDVTVRVGFSGLPEGTDATLTLKRMALRLLLRKPLPTWVMSSPLIRTVLFLQSETRCLAPLPLVASLPLVLLLLLDPISE